MPSIFDSTTRAALLGRIERLSPHSKRQWGQMSAAQMQVHIGDGLRIALGTKHCAPKRGPLRFPPLRWLVIHSPIPWPQGAPTAPELLNPHTAEWDADRAQLVADIKQVAARGEKANWAEHPAFGKLSGRSWGVLMWRHIDHHLRQFGV
jgi:Protein of unknown function (DUF1569)